MADYSRGSVLAGETITLRVVFVDSQGNLVDPDGSNIGSSSIPPVLYIYDESVDLELIDEDMDSLTFANAIVGPLDSVRLSQGYFQYSYVVPTSYEAGLWHDVWVGVIHGITNISRLSFTVEEAIDIDDQAIGPNTMLVVELADTITNLAGDTSLEETRLFYTTTYSPLYASPDLVRAEVGPWIEYISDDTLALLIHWSSLEAQFIQGPKQEAWGNLQLARTKFVVYDAALRAVTQPGGGNSAGYSTGGSKSLGDLKIDQGNIVAEVSSKEVDRLKREKDIWWRVVNAGGNIVPGQGFMPQVAIKGLYDPDRRLQGRAWQDPRDSYFDIPTVNRKVREGSRRKGTWQYEELRRRY